MTAPILARAPQTLQEYRVPQPMATRQVHPCVADPVPGAYLNGPGPMFQYPDQEWNNGEGFVTGADEDTGGWFGEDSGLGLESGDIHTNPFDEDIEVSVPWDSSFVFDDPLDPLPSVTLRRFYGYLRPDGVDLPQSHPRYGNVGPFVDTGAFELFCPQEGPGDRMIVIWVHSQETKTMPVQWVGGSPKILARRQTYMGYFSHDGLVRNEVNPPGVSGFLQNTLSNPMALQVVRPSLAVLAEWVNTPAQQSDYWLMTGYPVLSVAHRQTTLNEQRDMQVVEAIKLLLQEPSARNPLYPAVLTESEIQSRVVVVFGGGSNGGFQGQWATLRYPERVHGCYAEVINPSIQRLFGEHDAGNAFAYLTGQAGVTQVNESDFLWWNQYAWSRGRWIHDLSVCRQFARGQTYRPFCYLVGDEDVTSTGTDWPGPLSGGPWADSGIEPAPSGAYGPQAFHRIAWGIGENACHEGRMRLNNPYTGSVTFYPERAGAGLIKDAVGLREWEGSAPTSLAQPPSEPRTSPQELRGLDDPHEWALGRIGDPMPPASGGVMERDDAWFATVQPGAAGTWLGHKDAMVIRNQRVYVCGAEGVVTAFEVESGGRRQLLRVAHSHLAGSTAVHSLGHEGFAMTSIEAEDSASGQWELIVGTRRHLHRLRGSDLEVLQSELLPWEVGRPRNLSVGTVLPQYGTGTTLQLIYSSVHGGLVFYSKNLRPLYEWPEPGIADFFVTGDVVTILSHRGVIADVQFEDMGGWVHPKLLAASRSVPENDADGAPAVQGNPIEMELMLANISTAAPGVVLPTTMALWRGDSDGDAVRAYLPIVREMVPFYGNLPGSTAIATCKEGTNSVAQSGFEGLGDHLLVLGNDSLILLNQYFGVEGLKVLSKTDQRFSGSGMTGFYPPGVGCVGLVVGELVSNPGGVYEEEVVVATRSGSLFWMHIDELLTPGVFLPAGAPAPPNPPTGFWIEEAPASSGTVAVPRTNQNLSAAWALADRAWEPSGSRFLHVLDQQAAYWQIDQAGGRELWCREPTVTGARGWADLGNWDAAAQLPLDEGVFVPDILGVDGPVAATQTEVARLTHAITTRPWCPRNSAVVQLELQSPAVSATDWWRPSDQDAIIASELLGFFVHGWGGAVVPWSTTTPAAQGTEAWYWSACPPGWGDLVEGLRFRRDGTSMPVTGYWASTAWPAGAPASSPPSTATLVGYHELRNRIVDVAILTSQAASAERLPNGDAAVFLSCPGGRVRALTPTDLRTDNSDTHALDPALEASADGGYGGAALATRLEPSGLITVWSGVLYGAMPRPADYGSATGTLSDDEVAASVVRRWTYAPGTGFTLTATLDLHPTPSDPRGGYGVVGIAVGDLLTWQPGDEVVITTLAGDLFVYTDDLSTRLWRTHVPGSVGAFNAIKILDLDDDGNPELYVGGSFGLWRFIYPSS